MKKNFFSRLIFFIVISAPIIFGQENIVSPFNLEEYKASSAKVKRVADLYFKAKMLTDGLVSVALIVPDDIEVIEGEKVKSKKNFSKDQKIMGNWSLEFKRDGYFLVEIALYYTPNSETSDLQLYANYDAFPIYIEIKEGEIINYSYSPNTEYTDEPVDIDKVPGEIKPDAYYIAPSQTKIKSYQKTQTTYQIIVQISGYIRYNADYGIQKGVPRVAVYLDWDYDNNPNTGYTPYVGGTTEHVGLAYSDMNGYYYFSFYFNAPQPANQYSHQIRVYANNANEAAFDGDLGLGAKFPVYNYLDISGATTWVYSNSANITVNAYQGGSLRNLYRARLFSKNSLSFTPHQIRYYIRTAAASSFFCQPGDCGGMNMSVPRIVFNRIPDTELGYHEYGHFVEWDKVGVQVYDNISGGHWFRKETTDDVAWTEGFAEFYAAASHMYWYSSEMPAQITYGSGDYEYPYPKVYQFLDFSQGTLFAGRNNTKVEGAVACFLYNLWDGVSTRAPGYSGDNDDINYSGIFLLNNIADRWNILGQLIGSTHLEAYRNALLNDLDSQNDASVNALYNSLILRSGNIKAATPTSLNITGNFDYRTLSWNDNTCPNSVTYQQESGTYYTFDLIENQEQGFRVYRKATTSGWDGTLNGYTLVATLGQNVTNWTDNTDLIGNHSYVVVAYNSSGNSLPKAQSSVYYQEVAPVISHFTQSPDPICLTSYGYVYVYLSQGNGTLNYNWEVVYLRPGAYITPMGDRCKITYSGLEPMELASNNTGVMLPPDEIRCTVSNSSGSDTDTKIIYVTSNCGGGGGCPTLAFVDEKMILDENPLLISSLNNPGKDVTDYYLINNYEVDGKADYIDFIIHEPGNEHTWIDESELWRVKINPNEYAGVTEEGEVINYKLSTDPLAIMLNEIIDLTDVLAEMDGETYPMKTGDVLSLDLGKPDKDSDDLYGVIQALKPPIKEIEAAAFSASTEKDGIIEMSDLGSVYFRYDNTVVCKNLGNKIRGVVQIKFLQEAELDFFAVVKNEKSAKVDKLELKEVLHSDGSNLLSEISTIDSKYGEIYPGESISFSFKNKSASNEKMQFILKTVGRYEEGDKNRIEELNKEALGEKSPPLETKLFDNFPNPFNPSTRIHFQLKDASVVTIRVFDILGKEIKTLLNEFKDAGNYDVVFDINLAVDLSSGVYFYAMKAGDYYEIKKMLLIK